MVYVIVEGGVEFFEGLELCRLEYLSRYDMKNFKRWCFKRFIIYM